jgi:hypothetical protein
MLHLHRSITDDKTSSGEQHSRQHQDLSTTEAAVVALLFWVTARVFYSPEPTVYLVVDMVAHVTGHATLVLWLMLWNGTDRPVAAEPPMTNKKRTNTGQSSSSSSGSNGLAWRVGASMSRRPSG